MTLIGLLIGLAPWSTPCLGGQTEVTLSPRLDWISGRQGTVLRPHLSPQLNHRGPISVFLDGFMDLDVGDQQTNYRRQANGAFLQEAYLEFSGSDRWMVKAGRQSARWSDSWLLPSLDIWTARRWDRAFVDPFANQMIHSDGVLVSWTSSSASVDVFYSWNGARSTFPEPFPERMQNSRDHEVGLRWRQSIGDWGYSGVVAELEENTFVGASFARATEQFVFKFEGGRDRLGNWFVTPGVDVFVGDLVLTPQLLWLSQESNQTAQGFSDRYLYLAANYSILGSTIEAQFLKGDRDHASFVSLLASYPVREWLKAAVYFQSYGGNQGRQNLFGVYQNLLGEVVGLRLEGYGAF